MNNSEGTNMANSQAGYLSVCMYVQREAQTVTRASASTNCIDFQITQA